MCAIIRLKIIKSKDCFLQRKRLRVIRIDFGICPANKWLNQANVHFYGWLTNTHSVSFSNIYLYLNYMYLSSSNIGLVHYHKHYLGLVWMLIMYFSPICMSWYFCNLTSFKIQFSLSFLCFHTHRNSFFIWTHTLMAAVITHVQWMRSPSHSDWVAFRS